MNEQERKIIELENRIRVLENPQFLNQELVNLLIANGFMKATRELRSLSAVNLEFIDIFFRTGSGEYVLTTIPSEYFELFTRSGNTLVSTNHGLPDDSQVYLKSTGTLPSPLGTTIPYYVTSATANSFRVKVGIAGTAIDLTTDGTGEHYWQLI